MQSFLISGNTNEWKLYHSAPRLFDTFLGFYSID